MASGLAFLSKVAKTPSAPKAKGSPIVEIPNTAVNREAIDKWIEQKRIETTAESIRRMQEEVLRPVAEEAREKYCLDKGYSASVKIQVGDKLLQFSAPCKYSKVKPEDAPKLEEAFGKDLYGKYFRLITNVSLSDKAMCEIEKGGDLMDKIIKAVGGEDAFQTYFSVEQYVEPLESFHMDRVQDKGVMSKAKKAIEDKLLKPTTPSFREP
jgi:hypothetical protein